MTTKAGRRSVTRAAIAAALGVAALTAIAAMTASPAQAFVDSASIDERTATLNLAGAFNVMTVSVSDGLLVHDATTLTGGPGSQADWDSARDGNQTVPADGTFTVIVNGSDGADALTVLASNTQVASVKLEGAGSDDFLTGAGSGDTLDGGEGNDRLAGARGADVLDGGAGDDTVLWSDPDGSDTVNGDAGDDRLELEGSPTQGDAFLLAPLAGRVAVSRVNLRSSTLDASIEHVQIDGLGGLDSVAEDDDVSGLTRLSVDGGTGADRIAGTNGPDLFHGGAGNDTLSGGGGADRIAGDGGSDIINGEAGDDTLVWNDGDGSDVIDGDRGSDDVEVNGAATAADIFTVQSNDARIRFDRINSVPFSLDIGSSESLHANGLGGDDEVVVGTVGAFSVTAAGGADDDALVGGGSSETLSGGSGDDTISGGDGIDVVSGDDGDDRINVRDGGADLARGGDGIDLVVADDGLDILDGFETVDAPPPAPSPPPPDPTPPPDRPMRAVITSRGSLKVTRNTATIKVSCPPASRGNCGGSLALRTAKRVRLAGRTRILQLGHARYDLAPGVSRSLKVRLAKVARRAADDKGRLKVLAIASTVASGSTSQRLTLKLGRRSRVRPRS